MKLFLKCIFIIGLLFDVQLQAQNIDSLTIKAMSNASEDRLKALGALGDYYFYKSPSKSDSLYRMALKLSRELENEKETCKLLSYIGMSFNETSEADSILYYQNKSLDIALKIQDSSYIASAYGNIGNAYVIKEQYDIAIAFYNKALVIFEAQKNERLQAITLATFARIYMNLEEYQQAIIYSEKAKTIFQKLEAFHPYTSATINIGICHQRLDHFEEARLFLEEGKQKAETHNFKRLLRVATLQLGNIYFEHDKHYGKAKELYLQTEALAHTFNDAEGVARANLKLGNIASIQNRYNAAIDYFKTSAQNYKNIGANNSYLGALSNLIDALKAANRTEEALTYYDELVVLKDSIYNEKSELKSLELLTEFDVAQKDKELEIQDLKLEQQALEIEKQRNTKLFFLVFSGLLLILLYFVWRSNTFKKLNQHHKIKSKRYELEQRLLRSQMNPHFIFNALNSIQSYVSENNTMDSEIYLSRFSHLMRQILEHSQQEFILIKDDLNALESYLNLEQLRFEERFEYTFDTNGIDESMVMIPPMLLQPFVENAILHGLEPKPSEGKVSIIISIKKTIQKGSGYGVLVCEITDNGIGRIAAAKKETSPNREHVSLALKLTQERLASYSETTNEKYHIRIDDLYESQVASGTKVNIEMPYTQDLI